MEARTRQRRGRKIGRRENRGGGRGECRSGVGSEGLVKLLLGPRHSGENIEFVAMNILVTSGLLERIISRARGSSAQLSLCVCVCTKGQRVPETSRARREKTRGEKRSRAHLDILSRVSPGLNGRTCRKGRRSLRRRRRSSIEIFPRSRTHVIGWTKSSSLNQEFRSAEL